MKKGDKVKVVSLDQQIGESSNWILEEGKDIKIGDTFIIEKVTKKDWLKLTKLDFYHPRSKFKLVN